MSDAPHNWAGLYILDEHDDPVPCYDTRTWSRWMEEEGRKKDRRRIAQDYDEGDSTKQVLVSTVFLGLDHSFGFGPPVLWETMAFLNGHEMDGCSRRYTSKDAALKGHQEVCEIVSKAIKASAKELPSQ